MIIRFAFFISLVALFFYYCKDDSGDQFRQPNDINLLEVPNEIYPTFQYDTEPEKTMLLDSSIHFISVNQPYPASSDLLFSAFPQNY